MVIKTSDVALSAQDNGNIQTDTVQQYQEIYNHTNQKGLSRLGAIEFPVALPQS